jgi:hypothetical protein
MFDTGASTSLYSHKNTLFSPLQPHRPSAFRVTNRVTAIAPAGTAVTRDGFAVAAARGPSPGIATQVRRRGHGLPVDTLIPLRIRQASPGIAGPSTLTMLLADLLCAGQRRSLVR